MCSAQSRGMSGGSIDVAINCEANGEDLAEVSKRGK